MRTTVEIPDELLKRAKRAALDRNTTLKELITRGLDKELASPDGSDAGRRVHFPLIEVDPECPAVRLSIDQIKEIEAEQQAKSHRELLARR